MSDPRNTAGAPRGPAGAPRDDASVSGGWTRARRSLWRAKWPVLALLAIFAVSILYFYAPNVRHLRVRWATAGALLAIVAWVLATTGFAIYVLNLSHYNKTYGWLGGAIVLLLWLYLSNLVVVAGAEIDAEFVRVRQLMAGLHAEREIQLPLRGVHRIETLERWQQEDVRNGRLLRERGERRRAKAPSA